MPDYRLNEHVRTARHAVALDDERDTFHPLLWDEIRSKNPGRDPAGVVRRRAFRRWRRLPRRRGILQAARMDDGPGGGGRAYIRVACVGGNPPDGYVHRPAARFPPRPRGIFRYQPRKIGAHINPPDPTTRLMQDPKQPASQLRTVNIHESVLQRIATANDGYAPIVLTGDYTIVANDGTVRPVSDPRRRPTRSASGIGCGTGKSVISPRCSCRCASRCSRCGNGCPTRRPVPGRHACWRRPSRVPARFCPVLPSRGLPLLPLPRVGPLSLSPSSVGCCGAAASCKTAYAARCGPCGSAALRLGVVTAPPATWSPLRINRLRTSEIYQGFFQRLKSRRWLPPAFGAPLLLLLIAAGLTGGRGCGGARRHLGGRGRRRVPRGR